MLFHINTHTQSLFMYDYNYWQKWIQVTICQTDPILTLIWVIVSKWVLSIILQACHKLYKICFLYTFYRPNEKTAKIWCFSATSPFYIIFTDGLSIWTLPFIITYLNIIKIFHLINSKSTLGRFHATTAPCYWICTY